MKKLNLFLEKGAGSKRERSIGQLPLLAGDQTQNTHVP